MPSDTELRMQCLTLATAGMWVTTVDVIARAQALYDFAMAKPAAGDGAKQSAVNVSDLNAVGNITLTNAAA